jgi:penicillin amidase
MPGDGFTINVGFMDFSNSNNPYTVTKAASMRAVYDLADLDKSQFIYQTGQSGWVNNRNYSSYANAWAKHEYLPLSMNPSSITHTSVLKPDPNRVTEPQKKKPENRAPDRRK